jgi:MFS transporter, AAHS family, 4-hydroxybenzoate transporter
VAALRIEELIDTQHFGRFNAGLLLWSFLAMMSDGFDISALASAAPQLSSAWHLAPQAFSAAFSASLFGVLIGAPLLGIAGDRYGRKPAIVGGCALYGLATLATVWASDLNQVTVYRLIAGVGLGGLMPNTIALNSELTPARLRAALVVLMFTGITIGASFAGMVQAWLIPRWGWPIMFWVGGLVPLAVALCLTVALPESVKFLAAAPGRRAQLLRTLRRLCPDLHLEDGVQLERSPEPVPSGVGLRQLFGPRLLWITPLLWSCFATALMANYFLNSWLPLIFVRQGLSAQQSGGAISLYHLGGTAGGLMVCLVLGRFGFASISALFALAMIAIAAIGLPGISVLQMTLAVTLAGCCTLGAQFGNNAAAGLLYPTAIRSRGVGWALAIGRFGSVLGPLVGGALLGMQLTLQQLFLLAATPMLIGVLCSLLLMRLHRRRFASLRLQAAVTEAANSPSG